MAKPPVSIVLPVRDSEATVSATIDSCLAQSFGDFEFVIVDHHSTDGTRSILQAAADRDSRIRIVQPPSDASFVDVVNLAWRQSHGDLIARIDADDVAHADRIAKQVDFLAAHPEIAACGTLVRIQQRTVLSIGETTIESAAAGYRAYEQWLNSVVTPEQIATERFVDSPLANPSSMIRRSALEQMEGYADRVWAEDYDLFLRMLDAGMRLGKVPQVLLDWFDSPGRTTRTSDRYSPENFRLAKSFYLSRIPKIVEYGVAICGAGPIGKLIGRELQEAEGRKVHAYFEVNPRRVGESIRGAPVLDFHSMSDFRKQESRAVLLAAVGQSGARERIRELATAVGYVEGEDFYCVA